MGFIFSITGNTESSKKSFLGGMLFSSDSKGVINAFNLPNHEYIKKNGVSNEENFKIGSWKAHDNAIWKIYFRGQDVKTNQKQLKNYYIMGGPHEPT